MGGNPPLKKVQIYPTFKHRILRTYSSPCQQKLVPPEIRKNQALYGPWDWIAKN